MDDNTALEMGKRPSRQRRHLPTSVASAVSSRLSTSNNDRQHIPLLNMSFRDPNPVEPDYNTTSSSSSTTYKHSGSFSVKNRAQKTRREYKTKAQQFVKRSTNKTSKRKPVLLFICACWVLLIVYRIFIGLRQKDLNNLSIVHFISKIFGNT